MKTPDPGPKLGIEPIGPSCCEETLTTDPCEETENHHETLMNADKTDTGIIDSNTERCQT